MFATGCGILIVLMGTVALFPNALTTRAIGSIAVVGILLMAASLLTLAWRALP